MGHDLLSINAMLSLLPKKNTHFHKYTLAIFGLGFDSPIGLRGISISRNFSIQKKQKQYRYRKFQIFLKLTDMWYILSAFSCTTECNDTSEPWKTIAGALSKKCKVPLLPIQSYTLLFSQGCQYILLWGFNRPFFMESRVSFYIECLGSIV